MQLRTELQHSWATSVEILDIFEGLKLKTSMEGHGKWRRFFQLTGNLVSYHEDENLEGYTDLFEIICELNDLDNELQARKKLFKYGLAIRIATDKENLPELTLKHKGLFLVSIRGLSIKPDEGEISVSVELDTFGTKDTERALSELVKNEADIEVISTVLLSAGDIRNVIKAYPN